MPVGSKLLTLLSSSFHLRHFTVPLLARYSRYPIVDFSSVAASHVHQHFVFASTQPVLCRRFACLIHTEAVLKEECGESSTSFPKSNSSHPWPEWSKLAGLLREKGYSDRCIYSGEDDDSFLVDEDLAEDFLKDARASLAFARDRPDILRLLTRKNIEAVVMNASPFLFKNGDYSVRRMKMLFTGEGSSELELEKAQTIDVMRYLLSYVYGPLSSSDFNGLISNKLVERSVRKLLSELFNLSGTVWKSKSADSTSMEVPLSNQQFRPPGQYTEMRSGNLIYPKIPGQTSAASENQSSASFNLIDAEYGKNMAYERQDSEKKPLGDCGNGFNSNSSDMYMNQTNSPNKLNINYNASFVESSTSLLDKNAESYGRGLASGTFNTNSAESSTESRQVPRHLGNNSSSSLLYGETNATSSVVSPGNLWREEYCSTTHNRFNANSTPPSYSGSGSTYGTQTAPTYQPPSNSCHNRDSYAVQHLNSTQPSSSHSWSSSNTLNGGTAMISSCPPSNYNNSFSGKCANSTPPTSNSWDDKNRSYGGSSPHSSQPSFSNDCQRNYNVQYDGHARPNTWNNYVLNDGFAMKSSQASGNSWSNKETSFGRPTTYSSQPPNCTWNNGNINNTSNSWNSDSCVGFTADPNRGYPATSTHPSHNAWSSNITYSEGATANPPFQTSDGHSWNNNTQAQTQNACENRSYGYSGKSLEGSCVKEPDPLDMSEEAKAERWFRRAAQIKDISELSQIPDEDFPQIMPMRKGVNRFVVSKRKTPLERRLASQQYKRDFPVVGSEPEKEPTVGEGDT